MSVKVLAVGVDNGGGGSGPGAIERALRVTWTGQDVHSCLATVCMVVVHAEDEAVSIGRGLRVKKCQC